LRTWKSRDRSVAPPCAQRRAVPTAEKLNSIFEPHTDLIKGGKVQTPIEFGHKVFLAESAHGLITQYEVLYGNSVDEQHGVPSLKRHNQAFGRAPDLFATKIAPQMTGHPQGC
jgi:transposase, IS5 family